MTLTQFSAKICIIGDAMVGKSTVASCGPTCRSQVTKYSHTIGISFFKHEIHLFDLAQPSKASLTCWELSSDPKFTMLEAAYLRASRAVMVVCDLSNPSSVDKVAVYISRIRATLTNAYVHVVANKSDLALYPWQLDAITLFATDQRVGFSSINTCSIEEIDQIFHAITHQIFPYQSETNQSETNQSETNQEETLRSLRRLTSSNF